MAKSTLQRQTPFFTAMNICSCNGADLNLDVTRRSYSCSEICYKFFTYDQGRQLSHCKVDLSLQSSFHLLLLFILILLTYLFMDVYVWVCACVCVQSFRLQICVLSCKRAHCSDKIFAASPFEFRRLPPVLTNINAATPPHCRSAEGL